MAMIQEFVDRFMDRKDELEARFAAKHPDSYTDIVWAVVSIIRDGYGSPDPKRIHRINDGHYQGTLVYVIAEEGYQPRDYWYVRVSYGSCSACDTLQRIRNYSDDPPTEQQVKDYMTLALHIVQGIRRMGGDAA